MTDRVDPHHPMGRLLSRAQVADPQDVVETLSLTVAEEGGSDVVLYLVDYDHTRLKPHPDVLPHGKRPKIATIEGSMAGRVFTSGQILAAQSETGWTVWVPVTERAEKLGVLALSLPDWDDHLQDFCIDLGITTAQLVVTSSQYTDRLHRLRRRKEMSLAAEMQWGALPPLTFSLHGTTVAGLLEPAYDVGGDSFDYALNGDILDLAVFDSMGHGIASAVLGFLAVSAYRNARRETQPTDLDSLLRDCDSAVAEYTGGEAFVTAILAQLSIATGQLQWISAGHEQPIIVRNGSTLPPVATQVAVAPLGLNSLLGQPGNPTMHEVFLQPGDGLLLYTDGVVDARDPSGREFGEDRLRDLLEREASSGRDPSELLRRLVRSVLDHYQGERLRDDASTLYLQWDGA